MPIPNANNRFNSKIRGYVRSFLAVFKSAKGAWLTDMQGNPYLDFLAGAGTLKNGHNNQRVTEALVSDLAQDGIVDRLDTATVAKTELLEALEEIILTPRKLDDQV